MRALFFTCSFFSLLLPGAVFADGEGDNDFAKVRKVPPPGVEVSAEDREKLEEGVRVLRVEIGKLGNEPLLPDVEIYAKAVDWALRYDEFFKPEDFKAGYALLEEGFTRAKQLTAGDAPWTKQTGLVVRGYRSRIDGSVQPYGLVVPENYVFDGEKRHRLDFWFHGRGETATELGFIRDRTHNRGQFTPADTLVLHPFGRYCNANKFAGEVDLFEALEHARSQYRIDDDRIAVRGFSMGGAACWQFAVHYADQWMAAQPGAGFAETREFLRVFQNEVVEPTDYEEKLFHLYDCTDWAINLVQCPTVAYSGEVDKQKQAGDIMEAALKKEGITLTHLIGPKMAHQIDEGSAKEIDRRLDSIAVTGRDRMPSMVLFVTYTLRYNRMNWVTVDALEKHWAQARVDAEIAGVVVKLTTRNVAALTLEMPAGMCPIPVWAQPMLVIDGQEIDAARVGSDRSWKVRLLKKEGKWQLAGDAEPGLRKKHGLQGPIDDAFMDAFVFVKPTGPAVNEKVGAWVDSELTRAVAQWRQQFRGDARVIEDKALTDADIAANNLVLWGDPSSNAVLARVLEKLPLTWDASKVEIGGKNGEGSHHVPVLIFPNPLNPEKYVVVNSGFTYREYDYLNNARQVPKLPDWALIDIDTPPNARHPGKVVAGGFFGEAWETLPTAE